MPTDLVPNPPARPAGDAVPAILQRAGPNALFAADEFFRATISNPHTRRAYARAVGRFLSWCENQGLDLVRVTPGAAGQFLSELEGAASTKNQALAALKHFFDVLVVRHAVGLNPFSSVRGVSQDGREGKTPEISIHQARQLFRSIDAGDVVGKRDRAVLGVLAYTGARINAVARLRLGDFQDHGEQRMLRFAEKGGKERQIPVRHDLEAWLRDYIESAGIADEPKSSALFRPAEGNRPLLLDRFYTAHSMRQMFTRRLKGAGLPELLSPHSFRVTVITDLLVQDVPLEDVQYLAGHSDPRTTQIYDRRKRRVSRNIVERISI